MKANLGKALPGNRQGTDNTQFGDQGYLGEGATDSTQTGSHTGTGTGAQTGATSYSKGG